MKVLFIPNKIQCFWCNGEAAENGITKMGGGINYITYFCKECGGINHFAVNNEKRLKGMDVKYTYDKE